MHPDSKIPPHVGIYIRNKVIPADVSVTKAAELLQVSRPALSNLLNGKASLSTEMATKLESVFGADRGELLKRQAALDVSEFQEDVSSIPMGSYVPPFLSIKAHQIHGWSDKIEARQQLPVLIRKLIHSTGRDLRKVDFPGYDNSQRKGWDGIVETDATTPWIPEGNSYWELGTDQNPKRKAENVYTSRLKAPPHSERAEASFVFVTTRNWSGKTTWTEKKQAAGEWKAVRAYDASDLEQWLEQSIPAQIWLAEKLPSTFGTEYGVETLEMFWNRWKNASSPPLTPMVFADSIAAHIEKFKKWIEGEPGDRPFLVAADSAEEAIAFLACLFKHEDIPQQEKDRTAFFRSAQTLRKLAESFSEFIPIVSTPNAERELALVLGRLHCIAVRPRNAIDPVPDISLERLHHMSFSNALVDMGIEMTGIDQLARQSGRSVTILRRCLSNIPAIREPRWASDSETARMLIPVALVGAWHADTKADQEVVSVLANRPYDEVERGVKKLQQLDDRPVWSTGGYFGIASKLDALFAISKHMISEDLTEFFWIAEYVLSERDPALDLPEEARWAAELYDKVREHSRALREGIYETLIVLAVHGETLYQEQLGINIEDRVSNLVNKLLSPFTLDKLRSHNHDLPRMAEAVPKVFLDLIENDLHKDQPEVMGLLTPASTGIFGSCPRAGLLWALECLGWKHIGRISKILANLARTSISDNWTNKPITSLKAIFRCWNPQTAASLEERMNTLEMLCNEFPDIGWQICISQLDSGPQIGHFSYRPRWRSDATGAGHSVESYEVTAFMRKAFQLAISRTIHDHVTLGDLVERLRSLPDAEQGMVWNLVEQWVSTGPNDKSKGHLRDRIRNSVLGSSSKGFFENDKLKRARNLYKDFQSSDMVSRYTWLFENYDVQIPVDEIENDILDFEKQQNMIRKYRRNAMTKIWDECGYGGVYSLLLGGVEPLVVGECLAEVLTDIESSTQFVSECLSTHGDHEYNINNCLLGYLTRIKRNDCAAIITKVASGLDSDSIMRLFQCAPFSYDIWRLLDSFGEGFQTRYWKEIKPTSGVFDAVEANEIVDRFLEVHRPSDVFRTVRFNYNDIETRRLYRLLFALGMEGAHRSKNHRDAHDIAEALKILDSRSGITIDQKAHLEFVFIDDIRMSKGPITNIERQFFKTPMSFIQVLALASSREDDEPDPPEWTISDLENRNRIVQVALSVLSQVRGLPGLDLNDNISEKHLLSWINEVRRLCVQHGREKRGDYYIGKILSNAPTGEDGAYPCLPACNVLEKIASRKIKEGFVDGIRNPGGMPTVRWEGEIQEERELAQKYRKWSRIRATTHPFVSSILEDIAETYERDVARWNTELRTRDRLDD